MITALQLIFSPFETWEKITNAQRGFWWALLVHLLPLLILALGIEGYLLTRWGEKRDFGLIVKLPILQAARYAGAYFVLLLAAVLVAAKFLQLASESLTIRTTYTQTFVLMAYGFSPIILARILDGFPQINGWVCWGIGALASISILYHGVGMVLRPEQTKGFGMYLLSILIVVVVSALAHFAATSVLHGKVLRSLDNSAQSSTSFETGHAAVKGVLFPA